MPSNPRAANPPRLRRSLCLLLVVSTGACTGAIDGGNAHSGGEGPGPATPPGVAPAGGDKPNSGSPAPGSGSAEPGGSGGGAPNATCGPAPTRIWPLTPAQYLHSIQAVLPRAAVTDEALAAALAEGNGFSNEADRLGLTEVYVGEMLDTVHALATAAAAAPAELAPCLVQSPVTEACRRELVTGLGARAFRRPLTDAETDELMAYLARSAGGADAQAGLRRFLMFLFTSPSFVYRTELGAEDAGTGPTALTAFERASALSYFLSDGPPDAALFAAAKGGALDQPAGLEAEARRLLAQPTSARGFAKLFHELFETDAARSTDKDSAAFPEWTESLAAALSAESNAFVDQVLWGEGARLETLLTAEFSMLNPALAGFYGADGASGSGFSKVSFGAKERAGILTHAGRLAHLAKGDDTDAVARGRFVREVLLCQHLPPPPEDVEVVPPPPDGQRTQRERLQQHSDDPSCAGCHLLMDPLGLAFETYDGIGRYRTMDVGKSIDTSGALTAAEPEGARFANAPELARLLVGSPTAQRCLVSTVFRYAHGRPETPADRCTIDRLTSRFQQSGGDLADLAVGITTDESFWARRRLDP